MRTDQRRRRRSGGEPRVDQLEQLDVRAGERQSFERRECERIRGRDLEDRKLGLSSFF